MNSEPAPQSATPKSSGLAKAFGVGNPETRFGPRESFRSRQPRNDRGSRKLSESAIGYWLPPLAWAVVIFSLSCIPNPPVPQTPGLHVDKLAHLVAYGILGGLLFRAFAAGERLGIGPCMFLTILFTTAYGMSDETHQFFSGRDCELGDLIADMIGAVLASIAFGLWNYRRSLLTSRAANAPPTS